MFHHIATSTTMTTSNHHAAHFGHRAQAFAALICGALTIALGGCSSISAVGTSIGNASPVNWITPYRMDVIQGNFISKEQVELLKPGMPKTQVRDVLGTPLLASIFHADRWDYVFTLRRQGIASQVFKYSVFFKGDQLERFEGDTMPTEAEFIASLVNTRKLGKVPVLEATEAQLKASEKPLVAASPTNSPSNPALEPASAVTYPPLESPKQ